MIVIGKRIFRAAIYILAVLWWIGSCEMVAIASHQKPAVQQHSKDFKKYQIGSPEAVLTSLLEADLGDIFNRSDDDRFYLWWNLTEMGGVPDNDGYIKLYIDSYHIEKNVNVFKNDNTLNLEMDLRAIRSSGDPKGLMKISWRDVPVHLEDKKYSAASEEFVVAAFGEVANNIFSKKPEYFPVLRNKQKWVFPVRMVKRNEKWLIATDSIPLQVSYVSSEVRAVQEEIDKEEAVNKVCQGQREIDNYVMQGQLDYVKKQIGKSLSKFKRKFCSRSDFEERRKFIQNCLSIINMLKGR